MKECVWESMKEKIVNLGFSDREAQELINVSKNIEEDYKKLLNKYPIQYLIGYVDFYGYKIFVNDSVLIPRYETEFLVEKLIKYIKKYYKSEKVNILDIGTGSGCISIALQKMLDCNITAVDISQDALKIAESLILLSDGNNFLSFFLKPSQILVKITSNSSAG